MYCGSCLRDNALAAELKARSHDVLLVPLYTPTLTDEPNVSQERVFFGGISVYLQQRAPFFRWAPRLLDKLLDAPWLIKAASSGSISTDPRSLGEMTISMLKGEDGFQRKEFEKLLEWLVTEPCPDVIQLPNALLASLGRPLKRDLKRPVHCTLQGEDLFLDGLHKAHREQALTLIRENAAYVDRFTAVSEYYAAFMAGYLGIPSDTHRRRAARHQSRWVRAAQRVGCAAVLGGLSRQNCAGKRTTSLVRRIRRVPADARGQERPA